MGYEHLPKLFHLTDIPFLVIGGRYPREYQRSRAESPAVRRVLELSREGPYGARCELLLESSLQIRGAILPEQAEELSSRRKGQRRSFEGWSLYGVVGIEVPF